MILTIDPTIMINQYYFTRIADISFANKCALYPYMCIINVVKVKFVFRFYRFITQFIWILKAIRNMHASS